jgi:RNA-splicing ligase RtcB
LPLRLGERVDQYRCAPPAGAVTGVTGRDTGGDGEMCFTRANIRPLRKLAVVAGRGFFSSVCDDRFRQYFVYWRVLTARTGGKKSAQTPLLISEEVYYIHDMKLIQRFAVLNRQAMAEVILRGMRLTVTERFTTIHNYIDTDSMILRKGSVSAKRGERLLIPINMRDGSLVCVGKGNDEWNQSAPHGAGRLMSRSAAFKTLSMDEYAAEMSEVFSTSVTRDTLDESPMAYKPIDEIISHIEPTAEIIERIRPVYNFKASE